MWREKIIMDDLEKILVVGSSGTNGQALIKQLCAENISVRALVRNKKRYKGIVDENIELVQGDLSKPETLNGVFSDIKIAYIVTAIHPDSTRYYSNFFNAAKQADVVGVIKISAMGADVKSSSEILRQHGESDSILISSGLRYAILRPNSFYQNLLWEATQIKRRGKFSLPLADARQSIVDVRDIAEATVKLCKNGSLDNKIYVLTGPESLTFKDVAVKFSDTLGKPVKYIPMSSEASEQSMKAVGLPDWNARSLAELQKMFANGDFSATYEDLKVILGREPTKLSAFIGDYAQQF